MALTDGQKIGVVVGVGALALLVLPKLMSKAPLKSGTGVAPPPSTSGLGGALSSITTAATSVGAGLQGAQGLLNALGNSGGGSSGSTSSDDANDSGASDDSSDDSSDGDYS